MCQESPKWRSGLVYFAQYQYNARGERVSKLLPGVDHRAFVYDESGRLLGEYDATEAKSPINEIVWLDDLPVAIIRKDAHYYIEADHLGTPRAIIDVEQTNTPIWRWDLTGPTPSSSAVFGDALPNTDPDGDSEHFEFNLRFPGQYYDAETGLHYNYFRDYEPGTGRYIESDPIGLRGGLNTYAYVFGAPLRMIDPRGLSATACDCPGGQWDIEFGGIAFNLAFGGYFGGSTLTYRCASNPSAKCTASQTCIGGGPIVGGGIGTTVTGSSPGPPVQGWSHGDVVGVVPFGQMQGNAGDGGGGSFEVELGGGAGVAYTTCYTNNISCSCDCE
jgi:RHS repeat-associated protein